MRHHEHPQDGKGEPSSKEWGEHLTLDEVVSYLGIHKRTWHRRYAKAPELAPIRTPNGERYWKRSTIDEFLASRGLVRIPTPAAHRAGAD